MTFNETVRYRFLFGSHWTCPSLAPWLAPRSFILFVAIQPRLATVTTTVIRTGDEFRVDGYDCY